MHSLVVTTKYVYIKSTTVYVPSSELGLSQPLSRQRVCPSSPQNRGGHTHLRVRVLRKSQFRRLEKKLSTLPTLWSLLSFALIIVYCRSKITFLGRGVLFDRSLLENTTDGNDRYNPERPTIDAKSFSFPLRSCFRLISCS
jgi:hypothetical protein